MVKIRGFTELVKIVVKRDFCGKVCAKNPVFMRVFEDWGLAIYLAPKASTLPPELHPVFYFCLIIIPVLLYCVKPKIREVCFCKSEGGLLTKL